MEGRSLFGFLLLLVLTCAVVYLIYKTYGWLNGKNTTDVTILDKPVEMEADMQTCSGVLPPSGNEHTYSFWMYITQWEVTTGSPKYIFRREHSRYILNVALGDIQNELQVFITWKSSEGAFGAGEKVSRLGELALDDDHTHRLTNLPLQAWNHITLTIWGKTLDLYLNGKLARTFVLAAPLEAYDRGEFALGSSSEANESTFNGFLSRFNYFGRVVSPRDIYSLYMKGPANASDLADKPNTSQVSMVLSLGSSPECATAN